MSIEQQIADFEIGVVYSWGHARAIRNQADKTSVIEAHVLTSLSNTERDLKATLILIQETRAKLAGERHNIAAE